jgi:hypothetical protein
MPYVEFLREQGAEKNILTKSEEITGEVCGFRVFI